jgi:short-subunit dehydrogenase
MRVGPGRTVLLTGATGGIGAYIAAEFVARGVNLALVAYPGAGLDDMCSACRLKGIKASSFVLDLSKPESCRQAIEAVTAEFGAVDILVNNAGVEYSAYYHELPDASIREVLDVNLRAPMLLARHALPGMLSRKQGHIVNISSLAAKSGPAFQECYSASKAGLHGFTASLRSTYRGSGVSASVICPGFVEAGIYANLKRRAGRPAPALLGAISPQRVARAVLRTVETDKAEVILNRYPVRPLLLLAVISPAAVAWVSARLGVNDFFRKVVEGERAHAPESGRPDG